MSKNQKISFSKIIKNEERLARKKLENKLPQWAECEGIELPASISLEQASSFLTARFKAELLKKVLPSTGIIADLTGGYGSDSWAFSEVFERVLYFEKNDALCQLARKNFPLLFERDSRESNIECTCTEVDKATVESLDVDCIYADPTRRSESGKKVFLIEDCLPDMLTLLPSIAKVSPYLLIKYSPMADIAMLRERLSIIKDYPVRSIGVVGIGGEVKEVLVLLARSCSNVIEAVLPELFIADVKTAGFDIFPLDGLDRKPVLLEKPTDLESNDLKKSIDPRPTDPKKFNKLEKTNEFKPNALKLTGPQILEESNSTNKLGNPENPRIQKNPDKPKSSESPNKLNGIRSSENHNEQKRTGLIPGTDRVDDTVTLKGKVLLEPSAILLKSGYHDAICSVFDAQKIGQDCHLYIARKAPDVKNKLTRYVKSFEIVECRALSKSSLREIGRRYPKAEVTAKGLHIRSEELASMIGCRSGVGADGSHYHIFGVGTGRQKAVIVTQSI